MVSKERGGDEMTNASGTLSWLDGVARCHLLARAAQG
jgi:hypothetical protein